MTEDSTLLLRDQGDRHRDERRWQEAAACYESYLSLNPADWPILVQLGHCLKEAGDPASGLARYRQAEVLAPRDADIKVQIGHALRLVGRPDEAIENYALALALDPACEAAERELAEVWAHTKLTPPATDAATPAAAAPMPADAAPTAPPPAAVPEDPAAGHLALLDLEPPPPAGPLLPPWSGPTPTRVGPVLVRPRLLLDVGVLLRSGEDGPWQVQVEVARIALAATELAEVATVAYLPETRAWHPLEPGLFRDLAGRLDAGPAPDDLAQAAGPIRERLAAEPPIAFGPGHVLVALGYCHGPPCYARALARARRQHGLRAVPFVDGCLPLLFPELCDPARVRDQARLFSSIAFVSDAILVNSRATRDDLLRLQARLVGPMPQRVEFVPLDAATAVAPVPAAAAAPATAAPAGPIVVQGRAIEGPFVLCVATLEAREDPGFLFDAWRALVQARGEQAVPLLVCVGPRGWLADAALDDHAQDPVLQRMVVLLPGLDAASLARLHAGCMFTVSASRYDGWGPAVTESIARGRVPLVPAHFGLLESGRDCAAFYPPGAFGAFREALVRLIFDHAWRDTLERTLLANRRLRSWREVARQILNSVDDLGFAGGDGGPRAFLQPGLVLSLQRRDLLHPSLATAMIDTGCAGSGWGEPDEHGVPILSSGAVLQLPLAVRPEDAAAGPCRLLLAVQGSLGRREIHIAWRAESGGEATAGTARLQLRDGRMATASGEIPLPAGLHRIDVTLAPADGAGRPNLVLGWLAGIGVATARRPLNSRSFLDRLLLPQASGRGSPA